MSNDFRTETLFMYKRIWKYFLYTLLHMYRMKYHKIIYNPANLERYPQVGVEEEVGVRALPDQPGAEDVPGPGDRPQPPQGGPQQDTQDCPTARTISQVGGEDRQVYS